MSLSPLSEFETALAELDVSVTYAGAETFQNHIDDVVEAPAVGVALDEAFDDPALSLSETSVDVDPTPAKLRASTTGVTGVQLAVGDYGSLVTPVTERASELVSLFVDRHVAVVRESDVLTDMESAISSLETAFDRTGGSAIIETGPSATADMGELVNGAHGPREVHVVVLREDE